MYREMEDHIVAREREDAAIQRLGQWRSAVRGRVMTVAALAGVAIGGPLFWIVAKATLAMMMGAICGAAAFGACVTIGAIIGRRYVSSHLETKVLELAEHWQIAPDGLRHTAKLVDQL
jgi:hypothetical protein